MSRTTIEEAAIPAADEVLARASALTPVLRKRSAATNKARSVPQETIRDMIDAGLFKLLQPRRYGGVEHDLDTFARTVIQLARGCGSAGWVFSVLSIHQWMLGLYPDEAQRDVWGKDQDALIASALRPAGKITREKGGYRVSGSWGFASGIENSRWIILGAFCGMTGTPPHPDVKMMLVPLSDGRIEDNWHVVGLRGTGSKIFVCENAFVPEHRALDFQEAKEGRAPGREVNTGPLYRLPAFANFPLCICSPGVGAAWGAYDRFIEYAKSRKTIGQKGMADFATVQMRVAEASAAIDAAESLLLRDCRDVMQTARAGRDMTIEERARFRRDQGWAAKTSAEAAEKLLRACGAAGLFDDFEIQQCYMDAWATASHIGTTWDAAGTLYAQVALGLGRGELLGWV
jgi:alkylation response protein AidB-like acyl-CoA dehydrogenase